MATIVGTPEERIAHHLEIEISRKRMTRERTEAIARKLELLAQELRAEPIARFDLDAAHGRSYSSVTSNFMAVLNRGIANLNVEGLPEVAGEADVHRALRLQLEQNG